MYGYLTTSVLHYRRGICKTLEVEFISCHSFIVLNSISLRAVKDKGLLERPYTTSFLKELFSQKKRLNYEKAF